MILNNIEKQKKTAWTEINAPVWYLSLRVNKWPSFCPFPFIIERAQQFMTDIMGDDREPGEIDVRREGEKLSRSPVRGKATIRHPSMEPGILGMFHPLTQQMTGIDSKTMNQNIQQ
jgi:hypothetical protein